MEQIGTGDWIGLTEAAAMLCEGRQSQRSADDIVKAGYLTYEGVRNRLKIYTFVRTTISVVPYEPEWMDEADKLAGAEKLLAFRACLPGDLFELHPDILERILLLRTFSTTAHVPCAVIQREGADAVDGIIRPDVEIRWEDLRVDRVELLEFVGEVRRMNAPDAALVAAGKVAAPAANDDSKCDWQAKAIQIANRIGTERWVRGEREITARGICDAVAEELGRNFAYHGKRGQRSGHAVRNEALNGWKFCPDKVA